MRKIFTFLFAALMSVGMWAEPITVTWNNDDISGSGNSFTKDGVTLTCGMNIDWEDKTFLAGGTFTTNLGNFTKIEVTAGDCGISGEGWSGSSAQKTWTGNAASVSYSGEIMGIVDGVKFVFTIEEPAPAEKPIVVFTANGNRKEVEVESLPHTFLCNYEDEDGELDGIIRELYGIQRGYCDPYGAAPSAAGNPAVEAGKQGDNHFITISEAFDGTATVSGTYYEYKDPEDEEFTYTLTISIKGDEPQPQPDPTVMFIAFPTENRPENIELAGVNREFTWEMVALDNDPWYVSKEHLNTYATDTIKFRDAANNAMILCEFIPANGGQEGRWQQLYLVMGDYPMDSYKLDIVRYIDELDLSNASSYAWMENAPEPLPEGLEEIVNEKMQKCENVKIIKDGMIYIVRDGKLFNLTGAQVK